MRNRRFLLLFAVVCSSTVALSAWKRQVGHFCQPQTNTTPFEVVPGWGMVVHGSSQWFRCPLFDDGELARIAIVGVNVHVIAGGAGSTTTAEACIQFEGVDGAFCGTMSSATLPANTPGTLTPGTSMWAAFPGDWAYLDVNLCQECGIAGYFTF